MKIVIAPDSFKGSLSSARVAQAIEKGIHKADENIITKLVPVADGGEGTVEAFLTAIGGRLILSTVTGPLGKPVKSFFGLLEDGETAVIEMAAASGLPLLKEDERNPLLTTTFGTGELIRLALDKGARKFIIGIGGSATNDGGVGMAAALGVRFLDRQGRNLQFGGGFLHELSSINMEGIDPRVYHSEFKVACDVDNPLCGPNGASVVYGPQKGATPEMVERLDNNLAHFAKMVTVATGLEVKDIPGAGAAGGLGAGLMAFLGAKLLPGVQIVLETVKFNELIHDADLVITGEGKTDEQTLNGKTPAGIAKVAQKYGVPVICLSGGLSAGAEELYKHGFVGLFSIVEGPISLAEAIDNTEALLERAAERIMRLYLAARGKKLSKIN